MEVKEMKKIVWLFIISIFVVLNIYAQQPKVNGLIQSIYTYDLKSSENQISIQRAWFKITGEQENGKMGYFVILNSSGNKLLHNAFIWMAVPPLSFIPESKITIGKYIPIFGRNWPTFPADIYTINFNQAGVKTLIIRDLGVTWTVSQKKWEYKLSLMNGQEAINDNGLDDNRSKDFYARFLYKPLSCLEFGSSLRLGKSKEGKSEVWGADFLAGNDKIKLMGELICSHQKENIFGWNLLAVYQPIRQIQFVGLFEKVENRTFAYQQAFSTIGINLFIQSQTRLTLNYLINPEKDSEPDKFLIQLQQIF